MISESYKEQNRKLHETNEHYGTGATRLIEQVKAVCAAEKTKDVLDYGCGKGALVEALKAEGYDARGYDPCVEKSSAPPEPADVVICTDVLEHVEPEHIEEVLNDLQRLTKRAIYLSVSTHLAMKTLPEPPTPPGSARRRAQWPLSPPSPFRPARPQEVQPQR